MSNQKAKFFAQYWGCNVLYVGGVGFQIVDHNRWNLRHPDFFLQLTPLSQISDEDAIEVFDILFSEIANHKNKPLSFKIEFGKEWANSLNTETFGHLYPKGYLNMIDYLRSKGYALPWMGIRVEEQISKGWVKLKTEQE